MKKNVHVVLAMSPVGGEFIVRLRMFPSLVSCCTIDFFSEWPQEALLSVATGAISEDLGLGEARQPVIEIFSVLHQSVEVISKEWLMNMKRFN